MAYSAARQSPLTFVASLIPDSSVLIVVELCAYLYDAKGFCNHRSVRFAPAHSLNEVSMLTCVSDLARLRRRDDTRPSHATRSNTADWERQSHTASEKESYRIFTILHDDAVRSSPVDADRPCNYAALAHLPLSLACNVQHRLHPRLAGCRQRPRRDLGQVSWHWVRIVDTGSGEQLRGDQDRRDQINKRRANPHQGARALLVLER